MTIEKIAKDIEKFGWHSLFVFDPEGEKANFHYTVGIEESYGHPEIIIFGLSQESGHGILTDLIEDIKSENSFEPNKKLGDVIGGDFDVMFKPVKDPRNIEYLAGAENYYKKQFRAYVMLWPDKNNILPTEKACQITIQNEALEIV